METSTLEDAMQFRKQYEFENRITVRRDNYGEYRKSL